MKTSTIIVGGSAVDIKESSSEESWRMVHDGSVILSLHHGVGITATKFSLFESSTRDECFMEAVSVGLSNVDEFKENVIRESLSEHRRELSSGKGDAEEFLISLLLEFASVDDILSKLDAALETASSKVVTRRRGRTPPIITK